MKIKIRYLLLLGWLCAAMLLHSQNYIITDNGIDNTCTGRFFDSGGISGIGYSANENKNYTLCPSGGTAIKITFSAFNLDNKDTLIVYDGNINTAPVLGKFTKDDLLGLTLSGSTANVSGCLTFKFTSDNAVNGFWEGSISCGNKCVFPTADITSTNKIVKLCPGDNLSLDGSASLAGAGTISQYQWITKKDTVLASTYNSTFSSPSGLNVELRVTNSTGCSNLIKEQVQVWVSTLPVFTGTTGDAQACLNEKACFSGTVAGVNFKEEVPKYSGGNLALPDIPLTCFTSNLNFKVFTPGQSLSKISDLQSICVDMEHSYINDLTIKITCPNGQSAKLFNQGGGGKHLGQPIINDNPGVMGTCGHYCWTPNSVLGELQNAATINGTIPDGNYKSVEPFTKLIGCPLNGNWSIEVCDMQVNDNGFLCTWDMTFDPAIIPTGITFTPTFNAAANDSTAWVSDPSIVSTSTNGDTICAVSNTSGNKNFIYRVINDFGCTYDTTLSIKIFDYPVSDLPDTLQICSSLNQAQIKVNVTPNATGTYLYLWVPATGLNNATITNPLLDVANAQNSYVFQVQDNASPGCVTSDTTIIKKIPVPTAAFTVDTSSGCVPLTIKMKNSTNPKPINFQWIFGDGATENSAVDSTTHTYSAWGLTTIAHIIETSDGCTDTVRKTINAVAKPLVLFHISPADAYIDYPYFCFQNATQMGGNQWLWNFGKEGSSMKESDCFMFSDSVKCDTVSLLSVNSFGCRDSLKKTVCIKNTRQKIYAPNAFTPNNDNLNETFSIATEGILSNGYVLSIFDKWGNLIFESNTPNASWDGKINSARASMEVYVYKLQYKDEFGSLKYVIGSVTLIR